MAEDQDQEQDVPDDIPDEVVQQLNVARESGLFNMATEIYTGLDQLGFTEAEEWVRANPDRYFKAEWRRDPPRE